MRTETAGCLEVLSVEGQNGDVMMRREENRQVEREEAVSATGKRTFLAFLWRQVALNQLFAWLKRSNKVKRLLNWSHTTEIPQVAA